MTEEQILELASQHLRFFEDGYRGTEWSGTPEQLLKFALLIHENGYNKGYNKASYNAELYEHAGNSYD
jgi:hypothetical protein